MKGFGSKFYVTFPIRNVTPEEGRRTHRLKCLGYDPEDEENSPNTLKEKKSLFYVTRT